MLLAAGGQGVRVVGQVALFGACGSIVCSFSAGLF
jgi:hypothetical protein